MIRMPFGAHRGEAIEDIDEAYLLWLLSIPNLSPQLRQAVERHLGVQDREDWLPSAACVLPLITWRWEEFMTGFYGHDPDAMAVVCQGRAVLRSLCSEVTGQDFDDDGPSDLEMMK